MVLSGSSDGCQYKLSDPAFIYTIVLGAVIAWKTVAFGINSIHSLIFLPLRYKLQLVHNCSTLILPLFTLSFHCEVALLRYFAMTASWMKCGEVTGRSSYYYLLLVMCLSTMGERASAQTKHFK